jgi:hypothetical protein
MNAGEIVDQADLILTGTVVARDVALAGDASFAFTYVTFAVSEVLKGQTEGQEITLRLEGGEVGEDVFEVVGMPSFEIGRSYLVFVAGNDRYSCPILGWWQGKFELMVLPDSRDELMLVDANRAPLLGIERGQWQRSQLRIAEDGTIKEKSDRPRAYLLYQDGVTITGGPEEAGDPAKERIVPAARVLDELRQLIARRATLKSFQPGRIVPSADISDVPETTTFRPAPPPAGNY